MKRFAAPAILIALASLVARQAAAGPVDRTPPGIRASMAQARFIESPSPQLSQSTQVAGASRRPQQAKAAIGLGFFGMLTGSWLGAAIEGDCRCQERGFAGAVIGAPVGAAVGAILGCHLAR
jgi:hypothetical protein